MAKTGRPYRHKWVIALLIDDVLYTPAMIAHQAIKESLHPEEEQSLVFRRIRIAMIARTRKAHFPVEGDGIVTLKGQRPVRGWYGWRWKQDGLDDDN